MHKVIKEMLSAQHLLYVSLKYTKTCDVILNLIQRWSNMIDLSNTLLLERAKKKKIIKEIPVAPKLRIDLVEKTFHKEELIMDVVRLYIFFRKIAQSELVREHEFRKNVTLRVISEAGNETAIDLDKLKEWQELLEKFINFVKEYVKLK